MVKIRFIAFTLSICFLAACAPSAQATQTAVAGTRTAMAQTQAASTQTQEARRSPFAKIDLEPFLFQSGDLPSPYKSGQIGYRWPYELPFTYIPDNLILQKVGQELSQGFDDDYLMIALYRVKDGQEKAYRDIVNNFKNEPSVSAEVGDQATYITFNGISGRALLVFTHCSALIVIDTTGVDMSKDLLEAFAQKIDGRLKPLVCNE